MSEEQTTEAEQVLAEPDADETPVVEKTPVVETPAEPVDVPPAVVEPMPADEPVAEPAVPAAAPEADADDLAEAIADANDRVEADDAAGAESAAEQSPVEEQAAPAQFVMPEYDAAASTVSWWPFIIYDLVWLAFAGYMVWTFQQLPAGTAIFDAELYPIMVLVGIVLTIAGPLLILTAWIASFRKPGASKGHLFVSALIKGAVAMAIGVTLWWGAILVLDQLRLGALI